MSDPASGVTVRRPAKLYTGVGSRRTPEAVCRVCTRLAARLEELGWLLRSGGAEGADAAFEMGVRKPAAMKIFVPWRCSWHPDHYEAPTGVVLEQAKCIAREVHPKWRGLSNASQLLHARNVLQVLGPSLDAPSQFLVCWTEDGAETEASTSKATGGTRTAIVVACRSGVPVVNLGRDGAMDRLRDLVLGFEVR